MLNKAFSLMFAIGIITLLSIAVSTSNGAKTILDINGWSMMNSEKSTNNNVPSFNNSNNSTNTSELNSISPEDTSNSAYPLSPTTSSPVTNSSSVVPTVNTNPSNSTSEQPQMSNNSSLNTSNSGIGQGNQQQQKTPELQKKIQASIPTYLILVNLNMMNKNTTDFGVIDLTVTLNNVTKVKSLNSTTFSGESIVMPFRYNAISDNAPIQVNDEFNLCASGEFLAASVCDTGVIKTTNPPLTKANIELG